MNGNLLPYGPALAAVIILALRDDKPETRAFLRRCLNWRAGWWYLAGPAIIVAYLLAAFAINLSVGASITHPLQLPSPATLIILLLMGGIWEEPGWTEYALPRLQDRFAGR